MSIVITGASGFLGQQIVPKLKNFDNDLLLVGRNKEYMQETFPNERIADYQSLLKKIKGYDTLIHLAIHNNDKQVSLEEFRKANVDNLRSVINIAKAAGIKTFIYTTSFHASDSKNQSPYAQTKREAEEFLATIRDMNIVIFRLPIVYGDKFSGKLKILNPLPKFLRSLLFTVLSSLKPSVHIKLIISEIKKTINNPKSYKITLSDRQRGNWFYALTKRIIDLTFSISVIVLLWWLMIIVWLAIKFSSKGSAIFAQERIGKNGESFICYKFRTMTIGTKQAGTHEVSVSSVTKIGKILRKTKIDELPQVWNIIKNELSLVGPRPCLPVQKELISEREKLGVLDVKGGITGLAQIRGIDMSDPKRLAKLDTKYLDLRSITMDIKIILATATGRGQGDKVKQ